MSYVEHVQRCKALQVRPLGYPDWLRVLSIIQTH